MVLEHGRVAVDAAPQRRKVWKLAARRATIALILAILINVCVGWIIAAIVYPYRGLGGVRRADAHMILFDMGRVVIWHVDLREDRGMSEYSISGHFNPEQVYIQLMERTPSARYPSQLIPSWGSTDRRDVEEMLAHSPGELDHYTWMERAVGWPALALAGRIEGRLMPVRAETGAGQWKIIKKRRISLHRSIWLPWATDETQFYRRYLPLRPLWAGFILNTLVYAVAVSLIWFGPGLFLRTMRAQRGRCPTCGYDLRHRFDMGCPECGGRRS